MSKTLLTANAVTYATATQKIFSDTSVVIKEKDRIGLIGKNGTGKTTFLKLLCGKIEPDSGTIIRHKAVGYVPQVMPSLYEQKSVGELLSLHNCSYTEFTAAYSSLFSSPVPKAPALVGRSSGGELTKLWISLIVASDPSILFLDEPTNHLDQKSIKELEKWLHSFAGAVVFVSHNRTFISAIAQTIWELDALNIKDFGGSYADFREQKENEIGAKARSYEAVKKDLKRLEEGVRMRETKSARASKAERKSKKEPNRSKGAEDYFRNRSEKGIGKIRKKHDAARIMLETTLTSLRHSVQPTINLPLRSQLTGKRSILQTKGLSVAVGAKTLLCDVTLRIEYGDRISLSGDNGSGKTMLIKRLMYEIFNSAALAVKAESEVRVEYIDQRYVIVDRHLTVFENLEQKMQTRDHELIYQQIGRFQFGEAHVHKKADELSGGEIARLAFAIATISAIDLLILDEPTNNLDIETMDVIAHALRDFKGSLLVVSHDNFFLKDLKIDRAYEIANKKLVLL